MALNNVPVVGQTLFASRDLINQNFSVIDTAFSVNHVPYNDGTGFQGMHKFLQMPAAVPIIATAAGQIGLYAKNGVSSGQPELYFQRQGLAANSGYAITESGTGTYISGGTITYTFLWTRLPSGLLQLWGTQTNVGPVIGATGTTVNFPTATSFPGFSSTVYNIQLTMQWNDGTGANANQALVLVQGQTTTLKFVYTRESQNSFATKGSIAFFAVGI